MNPRCGLHTHSIYSDGKNTTEEMIQAAIAAGLKTIGISDHAHMDFEDVWGMKLSKIESYKAELSRLKEKYGVLIEIKCGIEQDLYSDTDTAGYDYVIGSVHHIKVGDEYIPVDESAEILKKACEKHYEGDFYRMAEAYYEGVARIAEVTKPDIIGHFDLITKFCEKEALFDENDERYKAAWKKAADALLPYGIPFEINTGAITRGCRPTPYPSKEIYRYLKENGASFVYSSDSHSAEALTDSHKDFFVNKAVNSIRYKDYYE